MCVCGCVRWEGSRVHCSNIVMNLIVDRFDGHPNDTISFDIECFIRYNIFMRLVIGGYFVFAAYSLFIYGLSSFFGKFLIDLFAAISISIKFFLESIQSEPTTSTFFYADKKQGGEGKILQPFCEPAPPIFC